MSGPGRTEASQEAEAFRLIAEHIQEILWVVDPTTGDVLYATPAYERVSGRSLRSLYDAPDSWREAIHPEDRARVEEVLAEDVDKKHNVEFRMVRPDGEVRWLWARGCTIREGPTMVGAAEDITDRKRAEDALDRSLALLRATLDATADGIVALDHEGGIIAFNRRFVELWKLPDLRHTGEWHEARLWRHIEGHLEQPEAFRRGLDKAREQPATDTFDTLEFKDGRVFERYSSPERLDTEVIGRVWSFRDVTARTRAERALRHRTRRLEMQNEVLLRLARQPIRDLEDRRSGFEQITEAAAHLLETERVGIWLFDRGHGRIRLDELFERSRNRHSCGELIRRSDAPAYFAALEEERAMAAHDVTTDPRTRELAGPYCGPLGISSMLDAPIRAGGELVGVVCFEHVGPPREWSVEDESFAASVADLVSIAIEVSDRHRAEAGLKFLARASGILNSSIEYRATLANVARLMVPALADWCVVDLLEDAILRRVAAAHRDPALEPLLHELERDYPALPDSPQPAARALRSGQPDVAVDLDRAALEERAVDERHLELVERLGARSYMAVPLIARGSTLGVLTLVSATQSYNPDDVDFAREIADRAAIAIDNAMLYERVHEANRAKSNFLAVMSHELRTPLTAIMGYAELLVEGVGGELNPIQKDRVHRILLRSQDLLRTIEEILTFSRLETGAEKVRKVTVDVAKLVRDVERIARAMAEERGLALEVALPVAPLYVATDPTKLKHVLLDLVANAVKFTETGAIRLEAGRADGSAVIRVQDTGAGIAAADQERIFEPFVQIEEAMTREKGGTGLGLAVARRLARLLGGDVTVDSRPGGGSTFVVTIPA